MKKNKKETFKSAKNSIGGIAIGTAITLGTIASVAVLSQKLSTSPTTYKTIILDENIKRNNTNKVIDYSINVRIKSEEYNIYVYPSNPRSLDSIANTFQPGDSIQAKCYRINKENHLGVKSYDLKLLNK